MLKKETRNFSAVVGKLLQRRQKEILHTDETINNKSKRG